jgi:signal transduction histidine kinase/DNA-binding NarL/FixJ family response regulator
MSPIKRKTLMAVAVVAILASIAIPAAVAVHETIAVSTIVSEIERRNERIATTRALIAQVGEIQHAFQTILIDKDANLADYALIGLKVSEFTKLGSPLDRLVSISTEILSAEEQIDIRNAAQEIAHSWEDVSRERASGLTAEEVAFHFLQMRDSVRVLQEIVQRLDNVFSLANKANTNDALESLAASRTMLSVVIVSGLLISIASFAFLFVVFRAIRRAERGVRTSEANLARQNRQFKTALENMRHGLSMYDSDHRLEVFNRRYLEIHGVSPDDIKIGMNVREVFAARISKGFKWVTIEGAEFDRIFDVASGTEDEEPPALARMPVVEQVLDIGGRYIQVTRTRRDGGGWVVLHADITERRLAQMSLKSRERELALRNQHFTDLVEGLPHGLSMFDADRKLVVCNRPYVELYGLPPEYSASGTPFSDIVDYISRRGILQGLTELDEHRFKFGLEGNEPATGLYEFTDGRFLLMSRFPRQSGGWVAFHEDITLRVRAEREREAAEREAAHSRELERAAELTSKAKSDFLAMMSHEIRTPMNAVLGLTNALLETSLSQEQRHIARTIHESSDVLLYLLNDILDISKLDAGKIDFEATPFAMASLIDHVGSIISAKALEKGLLIRTSIDDNMPPALVGDLGRLRQVVLNLATNAVKFTDAGTVELSARCIGRFDNRAVLELAVRDTGIGMTPEQIARLFNEFAQADATINRKFGGTGLGLAISKKIVTQMGGGIRVESVPDIGSTFIVTITLPMTSIEALGHSAAGTDIKELTRLLKARGRPLRILLAEDNPTNQLVFSKLAIDLDAEIVVAANGREAVQQASQSDFDVVFMDMRMPEMDGLEATRAIRELNCARAYVPIIALTANAFADDVKDCRAAGMDNFLAKPLRKAVLFEKLVAVLSQAGRLAAAHPERADTHIVGHSADLALLATAPSEVALADVAPSVDHATLASLLAETGIDGARAAFEIFCRETSTRLAVLATLSCDGGRVRIRDEAHTLKGAAGAFGMLQVMELARTLEHSALQISADDCRDIVGRLAAAVRLARDEVEGVLNAAMAGAR